MNLWQDFLINEQRPIHKWKHYFPVYERHFARFRNLDTVLIEIGCGEGGSLQMWKRYLGPYARIIGLDINPACVPYAEDQIEIRIGHQADPHFLATTLAEFGSPDIIVDDGSHNMGDITASFEVLYPAVSRQGVYLVEDLHTAYWDEYGGGLGREESFLETAKRRIDELNADHSRGTVQSTESTTTTQSMHFYDSVVVFEKGRHTSKHDIRTGHIP